MRGATVIVTLSGGELYVGASVGVARRLSAIRRKRPEVYGAAGPHYWDVDIEAALAELAVAKALGRYWQSPLLDNVASSTDLRGVNVRHTTLPDGCLILHEADPDAIPFVLVRGVSPHFDVAGWCYGSEGKIAALWRNLERPCFMVPASRLRQIETLAA